MSKDNGGPAFPMPMYEDHHGDYQGGYSGMTLRDYFAIHCDQPGEAEIVTAAGYELAEGAVWDGPSTRLGSFSSWYRELSAEKRFSLYAKVRYAMADAMIKERNK